MTNPLIESFRNAVLRGRTTEPDLAAYEIAEDNLAWAINETRYPIREAMLRGCMSTCTGNGEHQIKISFETLEDMQEARRALYHAIRQEPASKKNRV